MKQLIAVLLCLFLLGCTRQASPVPPETHPEPTAVPVMAGLYDPGHPMEKEYPGLIRAYPMTSGQTYGIFTLGKEILALSGQERTTMTLFSGDELCESASLTLDFLLLRDDPSLQILGDSLSYYDPLRRETIVLDHSLKEIRRIAVPADLSGKPLLSHSGDILYYCTEWSVVAWDLESGIRRTVKELSYDQQELTALHLNGKILECKIQENGFSTRRLLSADRGLEIQALSDDAVIHTGDGRYFAALTSGYQTLLIFGDTDGSPELLLPGKPWQQQFYLPEDHAVVTVGPTDTGTQLDYYELNTGILRSSLTLEALQTPKSIVNSRDHSIYILTHDPAAGCDILYRWDVLRQNPDPSNITSHTSAYHTRENPDLDALEACVEYAERISQKYGIQIRIWEDAVSVQPWDYQFEAEHLAPVLHRELALLDIRLAQYPENVLQQTKDHFNGLTLCLVRSITGTGDDRSLSSATGIQFFKDNEAYVVITTGKYSEQALYHELYHVMETHLLTESTALDQWDSLNPVGFVYDNHQQDTDIYLQGQTRAFVDRYSMSSPKEDRARVLENAMLPGKASVFQSEYMQRKLTALCTGLREAFRLKKHPDILPWEQYLVNPLTPKN